MAPFTVFLAIAICTLVLVDGILTETTKSADLREIYRLKKETARSADVSRRNRRSSFDRDDDYYNYENGDDDYTDVRDSRHLKFGHRRKKHRRPLLLALFGGQGHGCEGHGCDGGHGWRPQSGVYNHGLHGPQGGTVASASAQSSGGSPHYGGGQSQASAQSASFSLGPLTATFSRAQASAANNKNDGIRDYYDY